jgi:heme/copper-type cytochrome/quinol oxidase subunit 2
MQHKQCHRILAHLASAATVVIAGALIAVGAPAASAAPRVINVNGIITGFTPKTINVTVGEQVSICLTSPDTDHDLTIPTVNSFQVVAPTGPAVCKTLTAPAKPGKHKFICSITGHESAGMVGSLVVAPAGAAAPAAPDAGAAPQVGQAPAELMAHVTPLMLGGGLLIAAMMSALLGWRVAQRD